MTREKDLLTSALRRVINLRNQLHSQPELAPLWLALKQWQSARLRETYADLFSQPRYHRAGEFFLTEIYGPKDFGRRDEEALSVVPKLARLLPAPALETLRRAVELDELSELLDKRVAEQLIKLTEFNKASAEFDSSSARPLNVKAIVDVDYAEAYRLAGTPQERQQQIVGIDDIGRSLERLAKVPLITGLLHMMRLPAEAAGFAHLHRFLQNGFEAFKAMGSAKEFLETIKKRETVLMQRIFNGDRNPFERPP